MLPKYLPILEVESARDFELSKLGEDLSAQQRAMDLVAEECAGHILSTYAVCGPFPSDAAILILAGKGHNAADALLCAVHLQRLGWSGPCSVLLAEPPGALRPLCAQALQTLGEALGDRLLTIEATPTLAQPGQLNEVLPGPWELVIDGLLGLGFRPPLGKIYVDILEWANAPESPVRASRLRVSIDVPSGLGDQSAETIFEADLTCMAGVPKASLLNILPHPCAGRLRFADAGFYETAPATPSLDPAKSAVRASGDMPPCWLTPSVLEPLRRPRPFLSDKRSYGKVALMGGSSNMPGAITMSLLAAIHSGAGLVTGVVPQQWVGRLAASLPEAMWVPLPLQKAGEIDPEESLKNARIAGEEADVLVIGPGLEITREVRSMLTRLVREVSKSLVIDASALQDNVALAVQNRLLTLGPVIMTPHHGEFNRIAGRQNQPITPEILRDFARRKRCVVILKGPVTAICDGQRLVYSGFGGPILARGGSGDILAGLCGSLLAQAGPKPDAFEVACRAVALHGLAAEALATEHGESAVRTTDLLRYLAPVLRGEKAF